MQYLSQIFANKKTRIIAIVVASVLLVSIIAAVIFGLYVSDYYKADYRAIGQFRENAEVMYETYQLNGNEKHTVYHPVYSPDTKNETRGGFIFYPGGKVEAKAYEPLMIELANRGVICVLVEMPLNLSVLDWGAAENIVASIPEVDNWYIGGHSLGGSMAATYLKNHQDEVDGLVLLGAYATDDVSNTRALSIYGSLDGVMNRDNYEEYKKNLTDDFIEIVIDGGNHSGFGMYGAQDGDNDATISCEDQIKLTAEYIADFVFNRI